jgi:hypothetical protein
MKELQPQNTAAADPLAPDPLAIARDLILRPSGLDDGRLDRVFGEVMAHSVDFADLYFQLARKPDSRIPMKSCCRPSRKLHVPRAQSPSRVASGG